mmetsp:Transcript_65397/g.169905  ORF Transcript_65397/g.169905 Transcript_65397/m.169905 type:complete len:293 (-) Transcript_65397:667-1545(-)
MDGVVLHLVGKVLRVVAGIDELQLHLRVLHGNARDLPTNTTEAVDGNASGATRCRSRATRLVEGSHARQDLSFQELQAGTATRGDVRHLGGQARLVHSGHGVAAADDGRGTILLGQLSEALRDLVGALGELRALEDAHGTIPDDGLAIRKCSLDLLVRLGPVVQAQPAIRDRISSHHLEAHLLAASRELVTTSHVLGQDQLNTLLLGLGLQGLGELQEVLLDQGVPHRKAPSLQEGEDHASADDELVHLLKHGLNHRDLRAHLGTAHNCAHRPFRLIHSTLEVVELLLQQEA